MTNITCEQFDILSKEQLLNILKIIIKKSYNKMDNKQELINLFNDRYDIPDNLDILTKNNIINILNKFEPSTK